MFHLDKLIDSHCFPQIDSVFLPDSVSFIRFGSKFFNFDSMYHFFIDDSKFESVWRSPDRYLDMFCSGIVMPDFSIYLDIPEPLQIYNKYRSHWLAAYFQSRGIPVLPCFYGNPYKAWQLHGYPYGSDFAFSSIGCANDKFLHSLFLLLLRLNPRRIYWFCSNIDHIFEDDSRIVPVLVKGVL